MTAPQTHDRTPLEERVKIPGLAVWAIEQMDDIAKVKRLAQVLRDALSANLDIQHHLIAVMGGWEECEGCTNAAEQCESALCCDQMKAWQADVDAAWRIS